MVFKKICIILKNIENIRYAIPDMLFITNNIYIRLINSIDLKNKIV